jgi:hypothetical protein
MTSKDPSAIADPSFVGLGTAGADTQRLDEAQFRVHMKRRRRSVVERPVPPEDKCLWQLTADGVVTYHLAPRLGGVFGGLTNDQGRIAYLVALVEHTEGYNPTDSADIEWSARPIDYPEADSLVVTSDTGEKQSLWQALLEAEPDTVISCSEW